MREVNIHVLTATGSLGSHVPYIRRLLRGYVKRIDEKLKLSELDIIVSGDPLPDYVVPEVGVGGYTVSSYLIQLYLDPAFNNFPDSLDPALLWALAHEVHHAMRMRTVGYGEALFDAIVSEGLADRFAKEVCGRANIWNEKAYAAVPVPDIISRIKPHLNAKSFSYQDWFFGMGDKAVPRLAGYALGYQVIGTYLEKHSGIQASQLTDIPSATFRPYLK